jgi:hypothetical protein
MYYRVAIQRQGDQLDRPPIWQWQSTVLSSLQTLFQFLRLYSALPQDHLRVFSSCSRESLQEQLRQENQGLGSHSVTAAQFLQERMIRSPEVAQGTPERDEGADRRWQPSLMGSITAHSHLSVKEYGKEANGLAAPGLSALERRRLELESGPGGDHDIPYRFALPACLPHVLAWMRLLAKVHRGEVQPQGVLADSNSCHTKIADRFATSYESLSRHAAEL